jgi:hypothetical protein
MLDIPAQFDAAHAKPKTQLEPDPQAAGSWVDHRRARPGLAMSVLAIASLLLSGCASVSANVSSSTSALTSSSMRAASSPTSTPSPGSSTATSGSASPSDLQNTSRTPVARGSESRFEIYRDDLDMMSFEWPPTRIIATSDGWSLVEAVGCCGGPPQRMLVLFKGKSILFWGGIFDYSPDLKGVGIPNALLRAMHDWVATQPDVNPQIGVYTAALEKQFGAVASTILATSRGWALVRWLGPDQIGQDQTPQPAMAIFEGNNLVLWGSNLGSDDGLKAAGVPAEIIKAYNSN